MPVTVALLEDCEERGRDELLILCLCVDEVGEWVGALYGRLACLLACLLCPRPRLPLLVPF